MSFAKITTKWGATVWRGIDDTQREEEATL